ncbi:MAG: hypothetical protein KKH01_01060 [Firmicutes bacterium]|nr:hypothetical protein [Bacillota bacterium]
MRNEISIREWVERFCDGKYESRDVQTQIEAGWYDWFCRDSNLANKTKRMGNIIEQIKPGGKINLEKSYIWFRNNCPLDDALYDDFRFADIETDATLFVVQISNAYNRNSYTVFEQSNNFLTPVFESYSIKEMIKWFN